MLRLRPALRTCQRLLRAPLATTAPVRPATCLPVALLGVVGGYTYASQAACLAAEPLVMVESAGPVVETVAVIAEPKSLWERAQEAAAKVRRDVSDGLRYLQRVMTYLLYGSPLVGLVPASYLLGETFPEVEHATWRYLVWAIQHLGPCFVKLAQWASTRPDLFPPKLIEKIEVLQDDVAVNYSMDTVERTLATAFGADWKERLSLDPKPLGSGSVAQVFQGVLRQSNKDLKVAVKMIHPHVEKHIRTDMELLSIFADYLDSMPQLEILGLGDTCREFALSMNLQLDLRLEARHLEVFNKKFAGERSWVLFPQPIDGYVTKNVLVETLMEGAPMKSFLALANDFSSVAQRLKGQISDLGCRLILKMVFFDNYIHGDLHPGNLLVQIQPNGDPKLVVLDCGIVYSSPSEQEHQDMANICLAFMKHDGRRAGRLMMEKSQRRTLALYEEAQAAAAKGGGTAAAEAAAAAALSAKELAHAHLDEEFCNAIQQLVVDAESESYFEHMSEYLARICDLARKHAVRLDAGYFKIAMALKVAEGISLALDRNLDLITKCIPIVAKAQAMRALGLSKFPDPVPDDIVLSTRREA